MHYTRLYIAYCSLCLLSEPVYLYSPRHIIQMHYTSRILDPSISLHLYVIRCWPTCNFVRVYRFENGIFSSLLHCTVHTHRQQRKYITQGQPICGKIQKFCGKFPFSRASCLKGLNVWLSVFSIFHKHICIYICIHKAH